MKSKLENWLSENHATMLLALAVWTCAMPLVILLTVPLFGWQTAITALVVTLIAALLVCWKICLFPSHLLKENRK